MLGRATNGYFELFVISDKILKNYIFQYGYKEGIIYFIDFMLMSLLSVR